MNRLPALAVAVERSVITRREGELGLAQPLGYLVRVVSRVVETEAGVAGVECNDVQLLIEVDGHVLHSAILAVVGRVFI